MHLPTSGHGAIQLYYNHYSDNLFSFELSGSIFYMEDAGGVTKEHLRTELGDNGIKPEGEWACSTERSNLRKLNKSWPWRGFIIQRSDLPLCVVTEPGCAPLCVNSQGVASDLKHWTLLSWQIRLYCSYYVGYAMWTWCSCVHITH